MTNTSDSFLRRCRVTGKLRMTEDEAKKSAKKYRKRFGPKMNVYECGDHWHIGHRRKPPWKRKK